MDEKDLLRRQCGHRLVTVVPPSLLCFPFSVDETLEGSGVIEDFFGAEETCQFDGGIGSGVARMNDVLLVAH